MQHKFVLQQHKSIIGSPPSSSAVRASDLIHPLPPLAMRAKYTGAAAPVSPGNGTYVYLLLPTTSTIACSEKITGFRTRADDSPLSGVAFESNLDRNREGRRPFHERAAAVITQLGAFSLQFRSRSGCVFVARWRSGLTIGAALSLARDQPAPAPASPHQPALLVPRHVY